MEPSLNELICEVLKQQKEAGFASGTVSNSRKVYNRLRSLAAERGENEFSDELGSAFVADSTNKRTGEFCNTRFCLHNQAISRIKTIRENGKIDWTQNIHIFPERETPSSERYKQRLAAFICFLSGEGKHKNTVGSYRNIAAKFLIFCENSNIRDISDITPEIIPLFFMELSKTWSATSMRTSTSALRSFLKFVNIAEEVNRAIPLRCPRKTEILPSLTETQKSLVWEHLNSGEATVRDKAVVMLILVTGMRPVDVVNLKLENVIWKNSTINIVQQKTGNPLTLPMTPNVGNALMEYICKHRPAVPYRNIFLKTDAPFTPLADHSICYAIIKKTLEISGAKPAKGECGGRLLRRNAATSLLKAGVKLSDISACLGHTKQQTTDAYLSADDDMMRQCVLDLVPVKKAGATNE
jgi:site-specific recombinase XerD